MTIWLNRLICLAAGFLLDMILGDPYCLPHPVRWIGSLIAFLDGWLRRESDSPARQRRRGLLFVLLMLLICGGGTFIGLYLLYHIHRALGVIAESVLCYQMLSMKCLKTESVKVYRALQAGDTEGARSAVSMIVGRDTERLDEAGIARAAVETVAENTSDGVIAPLFYLALGGGVLGVLYKTVNTMDSMVGYKNERYLNFGRYAAKLDDIANYIPSRIAGVLMIAGTGICRALYGRRECGGTAYMSYLYNMRNAYRMFRRDRYCHASPNSAQTESVCAGALGIRLAGDAWYFGKKTEKPYIGDDLRPVEPEDIRRAGRLLYAASLLMWLGCMGALAAVLGLSL
ncbi:MAG: cobalamin biosynthesis protein CobD [Lachnospiraceae bacterium]|nr:cobalamin biosynthesis protein CobD [Lachnospiraceae bacterium]